MNYYQVYAIVRNHPLLLGYVLARSELDAVICIHFNTSHQFTNYKVEQI